MGSVVISVAGAVSAAVVTAATAPGVTVMLSVAVVAAAVVTPVGRDGVRRSCGGRGSRVGGCDVLVTTTKAAAVVVAASAVAVMVY